LEHLDVIQTRRITLWNTYKKRLENWADTNEIQLPFLPDFATNNGHMFYVVCKNLQQRTELIAHLKSNKIMAVFHYLSLHKSPYYNEKHDSRSLLHTDRYSDCLVRLPMFYDIDPEMQEFIIEKIIAF
jgi:dTDP-4-amino-4,6-dideoxygalactose transaminase